MWARHIEGVIGLWLVFSWLIFSYPPDVAYLCYNDWICAVIIFFCSLLPYKDLFRYLNLVNFFVGTWLVAIVFFSGTGIHSAPHQNYMVVGLLLMMHSLVPSRTKEPPKPWVEFLEKKKKHG